MKRIFFGRIHTRQEQQTNPPAAANPQLPLPNNAVQNNQMAPFHRQNNRMNFRAPVEKIGERFQVGAFIGGRRRKVFSGFDLLTKTQVAIKFEKIPTNPANTNNKNIQLKEELNGLKRLEKMKNSCVPKVIQFGKTPDKSYKYLVLTFTGDNFETIMRARNNQGLSKVTVIRLALELIHALRRLHRFGYVHCSLSPKALALNVSCSNVVSVIREEEEEQEVNVHENKSLIYLDKVRLVKKYVKKQHDPVVHKDYADGGRVTGVPRYASINNHMGIAMTRRDDLTALGYSLVYLSTGRLPWQGIDVRTLVQQGTFTDLKNLKREQIMYEKLSTDVELLCPNESVPSEVKDILEHSFALDFEQEPDYDYLLELCEDALVSKKYGDARTPFEWAPNAKVLRYDYLQNTI